MCIHIYIYICVCESDRKNLRWRMRFLVKVIVFGSSLYRFTLYPDCIIRIPWQTACGKPFYTSTSASTASLTALRFLLQRSNCMVCYDTCQCNCKSQLHHSFSSSETSFEFSLLEEARMSSHSDMLHAFHSLASAWVANHRHGPMPLPRLSSSRIKIVKPDLQVVPEMNWDWLKQWGAAKEYA